MDTSIKHTGTEEGLRRHGGSFSDMQEAISRESPNNERYDYKKRWCTPSLEPKPSGGLGFRFWGFRGLGFSPKAVI